MDLRFHSTVLLVNNIEESAKFYSQLLNQEVTDDFGNCKILSCGLSLWKIAEDHIISSKHTIPHDKLQQRIELCFETENFDSVTAELDRHSIDYLHREQTENWGQKTIRFYDPDGNLVEVGESIPAFIKRMAKEGLSTKDISKKTSVQIDKVTSILSEN